MNITQNNVGGLETRDYFFYENYTLTLGASIINLNVITFSI